MDSVDRRMPVPLDMCIRHGPDDPLVASGDRVAQQHVVVKRLVGRQTASQIEQPRDPPEMVPINLIIGSFDEAWTTTS